MIQHATRPEAKDPPMGRVTTPARIENNFDVRLAQAGTIPPDAIRRVEVADALVDTGATGLCMPPSMIETLGLTPQRRRTARTAGGLREFTIYSEVLLSIQDRDAIVRVTEIPEGSPVLIGQIPLEEMDLVPFPKEQKLLPNPAHDGQWIIEIY